jgi:hypothetical protein
MFQEFRKPFGTLASNNIFKELPVAAKMGDELAVGAVPAGQVPPVTETTRSFQGFR